MRDDVTPFLVRFLLVMAIVEEGGGKGAGYREENQPVAGWELEAEIRQSYECSVGRDIVYEGPYPSF